MSTAWVFGTGAGATDRESYHRGTEDTENGIQQERIWALRTHQILLPSFSLSSVPLW
jgi:hypothetical protein